MDFKRNKREERSASDKWNLLSVRNEMKNETKPTDMLFSIG
jgi:hypothetical protein